eukprot:m.311206 g.311206  ORF g.311206 m.311206 type:complete len:395 (+) comp62026_c0_seq1:61-1245(+)
MQRVLCLEDFCVSPTRGFIPDEDPLIHLPPYFDPWTSLSVRIASLLQDSVTLRNCVRQLPLLDHSRLVTTGECQRAHTILTVIAHAFVWCEGDAGVPEKLPSNVAIPWAGVAESIGIPPIITHSTMTLYNWRRVDPTGPVELSNLKLINSMSGTEDEDWFFLVSAQVEIEAGPGIKAVVDCQTAVLQNDSDKVAHCLNTMAESLLSMNDVLKRMKEKCSPEFFYNFLRPYNAGWKNNPIYPEGLIYEGVWDEPRQINGGSAAQSSSLPCFSSALGIDFISAEKDGTYTAFLDDMRLYMPPKHREFLVAVEGGPSIREYVKSSKDESLRQTYNGAVDALADFRSGHIQLVTSYVVLQSKKPVSQKHASVAEKGTGGTNIMGFLKFTRNRVKEYKL